MSLYANQLRKIEREAANTLEKLGNGQFGDLATVKGYVWYRKGLLRALELLRQPAKTNDDTEDL